MEVDRNAFSEVFMIPLTTAVSNRFTWSTLPHHQGSELKCGEEVVGTLCRPSAWSLSFEATTPQGKWTFRRCGFLRTEIVDSATQQPIATFHPGWGGRGTLTFADGQTFLMTCKGVWRPVWTVASQSGEPVLSLHTREKFVDLSESSVHVGNGRDTRLSLLIMFTLYRIRQAEEDAATAVLVSVIAG
jgi:hypothetical protein